MSRRNFILLIIVLSLLVIGVLGYWYLNQPAADTEDGGSTSFLDGLNPFGRSPTPPPSNGSTPPVITLNPDTEKPVSTAELTRVSSMPVAGFGVFLKERYVELPNPTQTLSLSGEGETSPPAKGGSGGLKPTPPATELVPALRYVARANGQIYQTFADKLDERKFSVTIIPKVYEAHFGNNGETVFMRYLKADDRTIETFSGTLPKEVLGGDSLAEFEVRGTFLSENIRELVLSPDKLKVFYLLEAGESIIGTTAGLSGDKKMQVFDSAFTEWLANWGSTNLISLTTKPSGSVPGYMYALNPASKSFNRVLGGINGLTTLGSPNGKLILYADSALSLNIYDLSTKTSSGAGVRTLPEKCVWGRGGTAIYCAVPKFIDAVELPDSWYRGEVSFSDEIWKIDVEGGTTTLLNNPLESVQEEIDGIKLALDQNENYLFLVNKKDSFLWRLELR